MMLIMVEMDYHSQWKSYELPREGLGEALKHTMQLPNASKVNYGLSLPLFHDKHLHVNFVFWKLFKWAELSQSMQMWPSYMSARKVRYLSISLCQGTCQQSLN